MSVRTRTRVFPQGQKGFWETRKLSDDSLVSSGTRGPASNGQESCTDQVKEPGNFKPFTVIRKQIVKEMLLNSQPRVVTGFTSDYSRRNYVVFRNYPVAATRGTWNNVAVPSWPSVPSDNILVSRLLAKTNPSMPATSIPNFLLELREFPELVRVEGGKMLKRLANVNLQTNFGALPMMSDLQGLLNFQEEVDKLFNQLRNARKRGGIIRTATLWRDDDTKVSIIPDLNNGDFANGSLPGSSRSDVMFRIRGSCRWVPTKDFPTSDAELRSRIRNSMIGLTSAHAALIAWEAMPWSWLIDWFSNIGDIAAAETNSIGMRPTTIVLMPQVRQFTYWNALGIINTYEGRPYPVSISPGLHLYESKVRRPASAALTPEAKLPLLSMKQLGILASLIVLRSKRYS